MQITTVGIKAVIDTLRQAGTLAAGASHGASDRIITAISLEAVANQLVFEVVQRDGVTYSSLLDAAGNEYDNVSADDPVSIPGIASGNVRIRNASAGNLDYSYEYWVMV